MHTNYFMHTIDIPHLQVRDMQIGLATAGVDRCIA